MICSYTELREMKLSAIRTIIKRSKNELLNVKRNNPTQVNYIFTISRSVDLQFKLKNKIIVMITENNMYTTSYWLNIQCLLYSTQLNRVKQYRCQRPI